MKTTKTIKLLALADIHGAVRNIPLIAEVVADCDAVVLAGDITNFGGAEAATEVLAALESHGTHLVGVPGNCDPSEVETVLAGRGISAHGGCVETGGLRFVGVGGALPCGGATPNETGELTFQDTLEQAVSGFNDDGNLVLVTHQPAYGTRLDNVGGGRHAGSRAIRRFIEQHEPILAVSGHLHELSGSDTIGPTTLVNPGPLRQGCYAVIEIEGNTVRPTFYQA
ncbi:MAG: metallophosphoesterase family protein [Planctomycetota bacterium]|jgi:Icc-related predicted phosphoesterase